MKSIKLTLAAVVLLASTSVSFANTTGEGPEISKEVSKLLSRPDFSFNEDIDVTVKLTVNENNELTVLSVDSDDEKEKVEGYVKSRLENATLSSDVSSNKKKTFVLPLKMVSVH